MLFIHHHMKFLSIQSENTAGHIENPNSQKNHKLFNTCQPIVIEIYNHMKKEETEEVKCSGKAKLHNDHTK